MQNLLYTTNGDKLFELTSSQYGRNYRKVFTENDLGETVPGEPLLNKFHDDRSCRNHWLLAQGRTKTGCSLRIIHSTSIFAPTGCRKRSAR